MSVGECLPSPRCLTGLALGRSACSSSILGVPTKFSLAHISVLLLILLNMSTSLGPAGQDMVHQLGPGYLNESTLHTLIWRKAYTMIHMGQPFLFCPEAESSLALWWTAKSPIGRGLQPQVVGVHRLAPGPHAAGAT